MHAQTTLSLFPTLVAAINSSETSIEYARDNKAPVVGLKRDIKNTAAAVQNTEIKDGAETTKFMPRFGWQQRYHPMATEKLKHCREMLRK